MWSDCDHFLGQRLKCGTAGFRRLERSELAALSAVATTDLFGFLYLHSRVSLAGIVHAESWGLNPILG